MFLIGLEDDLTIFCTPEQHVEVVLPSAADSAVNLYGFADGLRAGCAREELCHARQAVVRNAIPGATACAHDRGARTFGGNETIGELVLNGLKASDLLPELFALKRIPTRHIERRLGDAE